MEFARRGPATGTAAVDKGVVEEGRRFLDPQPHGDAMLVIRDALLLQLQQDRLRQEIIVAELAKIDYVMALSSPTSCDGVVASDVKWTNKPPSFSFGAKLMPHRRWPVSLEHCADVDYHHGVKEDARQGGPESGVVKSAMEGHVGECSRPCCNGKEHEENTTLDEQKLQEYNENKESSQWELKGITMPVKKPKSSQKWTCAICHVETHSERQLQQHCAGKKHRSNAAKMESINKDISQKAETTAEPSLCAGQKTCPIKWSCSTCQADGASEADLKEHLNSSTHQQNIEERCREGDGMAKIAELQEAKAHQSNVLQHLEKQSPIRSCSNCQAICTRESELGSLLSENILHEINNMVRNSESCGAKLPLILHEINNMLRNSESWGSKLRPNIVPEHVGQTSSCSIYQANCDHQSDLEDHLGGMIYQLKIQDLHEEEAKQPENISPGIDKNQPASIWDCSICEAKCYTESHFENHCSGKKHQKKIKALQGEGAEAKYCSLKIENKGLSGGSDRMSAT